MLKNEVSPHANAIWNYRISEISTDLRTVDQQLLSLTLLPRTSGKFGRTGLKVNTLRYHCDGFVEEYLNGGDCIVAYSPDDVSRVWLFKDGNYTEFRLIEKRFEGKSIQRRKIKMSEMNYEEFKRNLIEETKRHLPPEYRDATVSEQRLVKLGSSYDELYISSPHSSAAPAFNMNSLYVKYQKGYSIAQITEGMTWKVLIVHGDEDEAIPVRYSEELQKMYDDCQLTVIHGDDHCYTRHLDQVLDAITVFLNRVR